MPVAPTNYAETYFPYKTPTRILGEPTYKGLKTLKTELTANASSVDCDLGGGDHGYLGLVLSDADYGALTGHAFVPPAFPGPLAIPPGLDAVQAAQAVEHHRESQLNYKECKDVEKALQRHILTSMERKYLRPLINEDTGLLHDDIPVILDYLFDNYGTVTPEEVKEEEKTVEDINFSPADPMITIYNPIEKLAKLAIQAGMPYSAEQKVNLGLTIIRKTRDFEKGQQEWNDLAPHLKDWAHFKTHFHNAQRDLKRIRGPSMQQAGFVQANHLAEELRTALNSNQIEVMNMLAKLEQKDDTTTPSTVSETLSLSQISEESANLVQTPNFTERLVQLMEKMESTMQAISEQHNQRGGTKRGSGTTQKTPDNASFHRKKTSKYCWTHGACDHTGEECNNRAPGHKASATKENKMGGSKAFCT